MILEVEDMMKILYSDQKDAAREEFVSWLKRRRSLMLNRELNSRRLLTRGFNSGPREAVA